MRAGQDRQEIEETGAFSKSVIALNLKYYHPIKEGCFLKANKIQNIASIKRKIFLKFLFSKIFPALLKLTASVDNI